MTPMERRRNWTPVAERRDRVAKSAGPELIVIGCSLGGMSALQVILSNLTRDFCVPIAVAQHRHKKSNESLPAYFRRQTDLRVVDAEDKQWIQPGHVYLAPADYHLLIERNGSRGAARIKARGGMVIAQEPETAEAPAMPQATIDAVQVDRILRLEDIAPFLTEVCHPTVSHS